MRKRNLPALCSGVLIRLRRKPLSWLGVKTFLQAASVDSALRDRRRTKISCACAGSFIFLAAVFSFPPPSSAADGAIINLTLREAVDLALQNNANTLIAHERVSEASGRKLRAVSELLPHLFGSVSEGRVWKENLATFGFPEGGLVGPFNVFDARLSATANVFDLSAIFRAEAGISDEKIAQWEEDAARQQMVLTASLAYIDALRSFNGLKASIADFNLASRLLAQARHLKENGLATGIDVTRAETRVAEEALGLQKARLDFYQASLQLERITGLPFNSRIRLIDSLRFSAEEAFHDAGQALTVAEKNRVEIKLSEEQLRLSTFGLGAAKSELLPKVTAAGDYGLSANQPSWADKTSEGTLRVSMPLFEGGEIRGRIKENVSRKRQEQLSAQDVKRGVEEDVHLALRRLRTGVEEVGTAQKALSLAAQQLEMAQDRFVTGVTDNVEVLSAQTALANARQAHVAALAKYQMARINFYSSLGNVNSFYLEGPVKRSL